MLKNRSRESQALPNLILLMYRHGLAAAYKFASARSRRAVKPKVELGIVSLIVRSFLVVLIELAIGRRRGIDRFRDVHPAQDLFLQVR